MYVCVLRILQQHHGGNLWNIKLEYLNEIRSIHMDKKIYRVRKLLITF